MIDDRSMRQQFLVTFFTRNLEEQRAEALRKIARDIERLSVSGWDLLRSMSLTWERAMPGITEKNTPGLERMIRVAERIFAGHRGCGEIGSIGLRPTDDQLDCFILYIGGSWGGVERRVHPEELIAAMEASL